jgi:hypothetical protein
LLLAVDGTLAGLISPRDEVRPEPAAVLKNLHANGIRRIVMLVARRGDAEGQARAAKRWLRRRHARRRSDYGQANMTLAVRGLEVKTADPYRRLA